MTDRGHDHDHEPEHDHEPRVTESPVVQPDEVSAADAAPADPVSDPRADVGTRADPDADDAHDALAEPVTAPAPAGFPARRPRPGGGSTRVVLSPEDRAARRARARSAVWRTLTGLAVLAVTGGVVAAGTLEPAAPRTAAPAVLVDVPAPVAGLVCAGPVRLPTEPEPGGDVVYDPQFDPSPGESVARLGALSAGIGSAPAAPGVLHPLGDPDARTAELRPLAGAAAAALTAVEGSMVLRADPDGDAPAWVAAALSVMTEAGDLRGLVAASCQQPAPEAWLVGGSTELGSSARLVLQNPGRTAATVRVELWGPAGPVELAGAPEYLVPAGSERVVLLEGVAAEQRRIVVRLEASGGLVGAYLQDSQLRGLLPAGVDYVVAGQAPATAQVVPGISVTPTEAAGADTAALRLLAPGSEGATVSVTLLGADGPVDLPGAQDLVLEPGTVLDVPLGGLTEGDYTALVEADEPVVAGALLTRGAGVGLPDAGTLGLAPLDRAWAPSVLRGAAGPLALPAGATGRLLVATVPDGSGGAPAAVTLEVVGTDGSVLDERELRVDVGTTTAVPLEGLAGDPVAAAAAGTTLPAVAGVVLRTDDERVVWTAVLLTPAADLSGDLVAVLAPVPPARAQEQVSVRVR
ncbi:MAG: hypothetical protein JWP95_1019 [Actinotalea sp.]|nr:hypothetical protein [Actinotalea sp.]